MEVLATLWLTIMKGKLTLLGKGVLEPEKQRERERQTEKVLEEQDLLS